MPNKEAPETITQLKETGFDQEILERLERGGIYATEIAATPDSGSEGLQDVCKDFELASLRPDLYTNFSIDTCPQETWGEIENIVYITLVPGWLSYKRDWILEREDGGCLLNEIFTALREKFGDDVKIVAYGLPTIGFEGAEFANKETFNEAFVSGTGYADFVKKTKHALGIPDEKEVMVAHSMGGRAALLIRDGSEKVTINPAVELMEGGDTSLVDQLITGQEIVRTVLGAPLTATQQKLFSTLFTGLKIGEKLEIIPGISIIKKEVISNLVNIFLGIGKKPTPAQLEMKQRYVEQLSGQQSVARNMAKYLGQQEVRADEPSQTPRFAVADQDSLVSTRTALEFVNKYLEKLLIKVKEKIGSEQWNVLQMIPPSFLKEHLLIETPGTHCNLFTDAPVQKTIAQIIANAAMTQRLKRQNPIEILNKHLGAPIGGLTEYGLIGERKGTEEERFSHIRSIFSLAWLEKVLAEFPDTLEKVREMQPEQIAQIWKSLTVHEFGEDGQPLDEKELLSRAGVNMFGDKPESPCDFIIVMKSSIFGLPIKTDLDKDGMIAEARRIAEGLRVTPSRILQYQISSLSIDLKQIVSFGIAAISDARWKEKITEENKKEYEKLMLLAKIVKPFALMVDNLKSNTLLEVDSQEVILAALGLLLQQG